MNAGKTLERAIEVFARGFSFTRSFTHPYVVTRRGRIWVLRDAPCDHGERRNEEWIATGVSAQVLDRAARKGARGRFAICAILAAGEDERTLRDGFKARGYRLMATEGLDGAACGSDSEIRRPRQD